MHKSLAEKAYAILKEEIITCTLRSGERICKATLSERLGIGMTPTRDALRQLALEGFVEAVPRYGYIVTPITIASIAEVFELRLILEEASARLAAERATDEDLLALKRGANFRYVHKKKGSYIKFLNRNSEFHLAIAKTTGNVRLVDSLAKLLDEMTRIFHLGLDVRDSAEEMRTEHLALAKSLLDRDAERAVGHVQHQLNNSQQRIIDALGHSISMGKIEIMSGILAKYEGSGGFSTPRLQDQSKE